MALKSDYFIIKPLSANFRTWSNTLKQFVGKLPTDCFSMFDHFVGLGLRVKNQIKKMLLMRHGEKIVTDAF